MRKQPLKPLIVVLSVVVLITVFLVSGELMMSPKSLKNENECTKQGYTGFYDADEFRWVCTQNGVTVFTVSYDQ